MVWYCSGSVFWWCGIAMALCSRGVVLLWLCVLMVWYCYDSVFWWCGIALALCSGGVVLLWLCVLVLCYFLLLTIAS